MRLVVDCTYGDTSAVFHRDMLDNPGEYPLPWLFDCDDGLRFFETEEDACAAQREYRIKNGFDPITGE